jgi:hypothetical protein
MRSRSAKPMSWSRMALRSITKLACIPASYAPRLFRIPSIMPTRPTGLSGDLALKAAVDAWLQQSLQAGRYEQALAAAAARNP